MPLALVVAFPALSNDMRGLGPVAPIIEEISKPPDVVAREGDISGTTIPKRPAGLSQVVMRQQTHAAELAPPEPYPPPQIVVREREGTAARILAESTAQPELLVHDQTDAGAPSRDRTDAMRQDLTRERREPVAPIQDGARGSSEIAAGGQLRSSKPVLGAIDRRSTMRVAARAGPGEPIRPVPADMGTDPEKVALGRALFHDPRLSKDNTTACVSCHDLGSGGDDGRRVSVGIEGKLGSINAPTVFNVGLNFKQFWDGRASTLQQQIDGPVQSPVELGTLWPDVIEKLYKHESYPGRFEALYSDGISRENVKNALAEFLTSLTTPNSKFDRWLTGDEDAIGPLEKRGYALFKHYGCASCHQGANVGGNMFQVFGVLNDYFKRRGNITEADLGRYNYTGNPMDRHAFKVPSLRMAALTAPYLHDGSADTLRAAVDIMFEFQLGREAPDEDKEAIVAFIKSLAGESTELDP